MESSLIDPGVGTAPKPDAGAPSGQVPRVALDESREIVARLTRTAGERVRTPPVPGARRPASGTLPSARAPSRRLPRPPGLAVASQRPDLSGQPAASNVGQ